VHLLSRGNEGKVNLVTLIPPSSLGNNTGLNESPDKQKRRKIAMEPKEMMKQMMKYNKAAFDNTFTAMTLMQEQIERMVKMFMEQATWVPKEGRQGMAEWVKACKKGGDDFKKAMDDGFKKLEEFLA
jgi:hypothetical protein